MILGRAARHQTAGLLHFKQVHQAQCIDVLRQCEAPEGQPAAVVVKCKRADAAVIAVPQLKLPAGRFVQLPGRPGCQAGVCPGLTRQQAAIRQYQLPVGVVELR